MLKKKKKKHFPGLTHSQKAHDSGRAHQDTRFPKCNDWLGIEHDPAGLMTTWPQNNWEEDPPSGRALRLVKYNLGVSLTTDA